MLVRAETNHRWSVLALRLGIVSVSLTLLLGILHGILIGAGKTDFGSLRLEAWLVWCSDFRYTFENLMYVSAVLFVGAKFFEARTLFTVGFDNNDLANVRIKGPDEEHIVWIGHRYANAIEAQTVADAFAERLKQSVA